LSKLHSLDVSGTGLDLNGVKALVETLKNRENLTSLKLTDNGIGPESAKAWAGLQKLTKLDLTGNHLRDEGCTGACGVHESHRAWRSQKQHRPAGC